VRCSACLACAQLRSLATHTQECEVNKQDSKLKHDQDGRLSYSIGQRRPWRGSNLTWHTAQVIFEHSFMSPSEVKYKALCVLIPAPHSARHTHPATLHHKWMDNMKRPLHSDCSPPSLPIRTGPHLPLFLSSSLLDWKSPLSGK
jgi:hypothetical protein